MPARTAQRHLLEIKERCVLILEGLNRDQALGPFAEQFQAVVLRAYDEQNLRGLRILHADLEEWMREFPRPVQDEVRSLIETRLQVDLSADHEAVRKRIAKIVGRGRILNDREYALVEAHCQRCGEDTGASDLRDLLICYR